MIDDDVIDELGSESGYRISVHGHAAVTGGLLGAVRDGGLAQATMLSGPPGIGKRTVARLVTQALLCMAIPEIRPCGECRACRLVANEGHPDVHIITPPLRIEAARQLQAALAMAPSEGLSRVAILPELESASIGASNSLLKTLEEPPRHAVLLLTTAAHQDVLPTVVSRVRLIRMRSLSPPEAAGALRELRRMAAETAVEMARASGGRPGIALRLIDDPDALADRAAWLDAVQSAVSASPAQRLDLALTLSKERESLAEGLSLWAIWWRDVMHLKHGLKGTVVLQERLPILHSVAETVSARAAVDASRRIQRAQKALAANANGDLVLEVLLLGLPRAAVTVPVA